MPQIEDNMRKIEVWYSESRIRKIVVSLDPDQMSNDHKESDGSGSRPPPSPVQSTTTSHLLDSLLYLPSSQLTCLNWPNMKASSDSQEDAIFRPLACIKRNPTADGPNPWFNRFAKQMSVSNVIRGHGFWFL